MKYEIRIERQFSAGHAIRLPDGSLEPLHGHNWPVCVTVGSERLGEMDTVMDFHMLEKTVERLIGHVHNRHLNEVTPFKGDDEAGLAINPTAERVAQWIGESVAKTLPGGVALLSVEVGEAVGCTAVYRP